MHLRSPSHSRGALSFVWAVVFFLVIFFGAVAVGVSSGVALVGSLVASFFIFLLVRTRGREDTSPEQY